MQSSTNPTIFENPDVQRVLVDETGNPDGVIAHTLINRFPELVQAINTASGHLNGTDAVRIAQLAFSGVCRNALQKELVFPPSIPHYRDFFESYGHHLPKYDLENMHLMEFPERMETSRSPVTCERKFMQAMWYALTHGVAVMNLGKADVSKGKWNMPIANNMSVIRGSIERTLPSLEKAARMKSNVASRERTSA